MATTSTIRPGEMGLYRRSGTSWSGIFAGTFMFLAIEVTFGTLGLAIFASAANPNSAHPVGGMSTGIGIWTIVLSVIALYFAGKTAARLSGTSDRNLGMYQGLVTFGMSIFAAILIAALSLTSTVAGNSNPSRFGGGTIADAVATGGWWLFVALVLGFIAAGTGGSNGVQRETVAPTATSIDRDRNLRAA